ncbi:MAG: heme exporter protein CcmB [Chloroflexota bacterium]|nr:heme exporter protein CcmB [Chloroflexota bacterium]
MSRATTGRLADPPAAPDRLPAAAMRLPGLAATFLTLVWRDLLAEWRTREVVTGGAAFALLVLVVFNFAFDLRVDNVAEIAPGVLWVGFAFAGMLGFGRSFAAERERGTLDGLLLAPIDRGAIYLAKTATNAIFMGLVELVTFPAFVALFNVQLDWIAAGTVALLGTLGFAAAGTLVSAIAANTRAREVMLPVLLLPLATPVLIASVQATGQALGGRPAETLPWLQLLVGFDVILLGMSYVLFEFVLEE